MIDKEPKKTIKDRFHVTVIPSRVVIVIIVWNINNNNISLIACVLYKTKNSLNPNRQNG